MGKALMELKKAKKKGIFFPKELAKLFVEEYPPSKIVAIINGFYNNLVINYDEVLEIRKKISQSQKKFDNPTKSIMEKRVEYLSSYVANAIAFQEVKEVGRIKAIWLASNSSNPSYIHMNNYGKEFYLDEGIDGEIPAERPNCGCGFSIIKE